MACKQRPPNTRSNSIQTRREKSKQDAHVYRTEPIQSSTSADWPKILPKGSSEPKRAQNDGMNTRKETYERIQTLPFDFYVDPRPSCPRVLCLASPELYLTSTPARVAFVPQNAARMCRFNPLHKHHISCAQSHTNNGCIYNDDGTAPSTSMTNRQNTKHSNNVNDVNNNDTTE